MQDKLGPRHFLKDGRQTLDWCIVFLRIFEGTNKLYSWYNIIYDSHANLKFYINIDICFIYKSRSYCLFSLLSKKLRYRVLCFIVIWSKVIHKILDQGLLLIRERKFSFVMWLPTRAFNLIFFFVVTLEMVLKMVTIRMVTICLKKTRCIIVLLTGKKVMNRPAKK